MQRDKTIDNLRGLAMLAMIIIHATAYFLRDKITLFIWDSLQWAVPVFLFCSFYLYYNKVKTFDKENILPYFKKRFSRLLIPYYVFLLVYFLLVYFLDPRKFNLNYFSANVFLYGGLDLNWLPLLFFYLSFLMPLLLLLEKKKIWFNLWGFLSIVSSIVFIFYSPFKSRTIMWLPWSTFIFFTLFFIRNEKNWKRLFYAALVFGLIFIVTRLIEIKIGHNLTHFGNKYPPTLYHLSYGVVSVIVLYWLSKKNVFTFLGFDKFLNFLSVNSYPIFFTHSLAIFLFIWLKIKFPNWFTLFLGISSVSFLTQIILNKLSSRTLVQNFSKKTSP